MAAKTLFDESEDLLDIRKDNIFKAVFTKDTGDSRRALSKLVSAIVGGEMEVLDIMANEPPPEDERDRQLRFDINCKTEDGEMVNVEMCLHPNKFEPVRLEFHAARLFCLQDIRGKDKSFEDLKRTYQIAILGNEAFFSDGDFFHRFEYYDPTRNISLGGRTRIFTLELSKLEEVAKKPVDQMGNAERWAVFFQYLTDPSMRGKINQIAGREEGIAMAGGVLLNISRNEVERMRLESEYKGQLDLQTKLVDARREGIQEGRKEGRREGKREGRQEGENKKSVEVLNLIAKGYTTEDIKRELEARVGVEEENGS